MDSGAGAAVVGGDWATAADGVTDGLSVVVTGASELPASSGCEPEHAAPRTDAITTKAARAERTPQRYCRERHLSASGRVRAAYGWASMSGIHSSKSTWLMTREVTPTMTSSAIAQANTLEVRVV